MLLLLLLVVVVLLLVLQHPPLQLEPSSHAAHCKAQNATLNRSHAAGRPMELPYRATGLLSVVDQLNASMLTRRRRLTSHALSCNAINGTQSARDRNTSLSLVSCVEGPKESVGGGSPGGGSCSLCWRCDKMCVRGWAGSTASSSLHVG
jgi:hypothetical protein